MHNIIYEVLNKLVVLRDDQSDTAVQACTNDRLQQLLQHAIKLHAKIIIIDKIIVISAQHNLRRSDSKHTLRIE